MGTRGIYGFFYKGRYYIQYNHYDSYPRVLGVSLILEILNANLDEWIKLLENLVLISDEVKPTLKDINKLQKYTDLKVSNQSIYDWYCLLHLTQGSFHHVLHSGYLINHVDANGTPMMEEYAYILNFDEKTLDYDDGEEKVKIPLNKNELYSWGIKWRGAELPEKYDAEVHLEAEKKRQEHIINMMSRITDRNRLSSVTE